MLPVKRFTDFITENALFEREGTILAAVSGGMDSALMVALLHAAGYRFAIAHCNFQLRGNEANADQRFCKQLAQKYKVSFHTTRFNTQAYAAQNKLSIQMAARNLRYHWFEQLRQQHNYTAIALGHHQNDTIETILLNLVRGTGIAGLHGILPKSGSLVRPLLFLKREEIAGIVKANKIDYVEDSSNALTKYARNKIRHEVVPKLKELNPGLEATFENNLRHFRQLEALLELQVEQLKAEVLICYNEEIHLSLKAIRKLRPQHLLLYKLLQPYGFNEATVDDVISALDKHSGRTFSSGAYTLLLDRDKLILSKAEAPVTTNVLINEADTAVNFGRYKLTLSPSATLAVVADNNLAVSVNADSLIYPLTLRTWRQGDFFMPLGMDTRKKLSDFFINQKIPINQKTEIPLLINGNGDVIWVAGLRLDNRYKVTDKTKKVTIFELFK